MLRTSLSEPAPQSATLLATAVRSGLVREYGFVTTGFGVGVLGACSVNAAMTRSVHACAVAWKSGSHDARSTIRRAPRCPSRASSRRAKPQKLAYEESPNP